MAKEGNFQKKVFHLELVERVRAHDGRAKAGWQKAESSCLVCRLGAERERVLTGNEVCILNFEARPPVTHLL